MDITEQIIDESLINSWNVFLGKREGGGGISEPSVGAICNVFLVSYTL